MLSNLLKNARARRKEIAAENTENREAFKRAILAYDVGEQRRWHFDIPPDIEGTADRTIVVTYSTTRAFESEPSKPTFGIAFTNGDTAIFESDEGETLGQCKGLHATLEMLAEMIAEYEYPDNID